MNYALQSTKTLKYPFYYIYVETFMMKSCCGHLPEVELIVASSPCPDPEAAANPSILCAAPEQDVEASGCKVRLVKRCQSGQSYIWSK